MNFVAVMVCEDLPKEMCSFSIASSGKRCLLETEKGINGEIEYQCRTSKVVAERMAEYIETDQCVEACGVHRSSVGISSDAFFEPQFIGKLCSPTCYEKCPNIVDLFFNLAAGEGKNCLLIMVLLTIIIYFCPIQCDSAKKLTED
jgi:hypothetical protein